MLFVECRRSALNIDKYFNKIYTAAYRLSGNKTVAGDITFNAINNISADISIDEGNYVSEELLKNTYKEVCKIYLLESTHDITEFEKHIEYMNNSKGYQNALLVLNPINRVTVVWRDVLGCSVDDMDFVECSKLELYKNLNKARSQMKELVYDLYFNENGA